MKKETLIDTISYLFIFLFLYTGGSKIIMHQGFVSAIRKVHIFKNTVNIISWAIPILELLLVLGLILPKSRKISLYGTAILMVAFTIYVAYILQYQWPHLPCSCGGILQYLTWRQHLFVNSLLTALSFAAIYIINKRQQNHFSIISRPSVNIK